MFHRPARECEPGLLTVGTKEGSMFRNRHFSMAAGTHSRRRSPGIHGALLALVVMVVLFRGDASAQARHYPLESTAGLQLFNATAEPATLDGKRGLRVREVRAQMFPQPQDQRTPGEALVVIEGLEFGNGVIEAEIAGVPAPGAPDTA